MGLQRARHVPPLPRQRILMFTERFRCRHGWVHRTTNLRYGIGGDWCLAVCGRRLLFFYTPLTLITPSLAPVTCIACIAQEP